MKKKWTSDTIFTSVKEKSTSNAVIAGFLSLCVIGSGLLYTTMNAEIDALKVQQAEADTQMLQLEEKADRLATMKFVDTKTVQKTLHTAREAGKKVAMLQNKYKHVNGISADAAEVKAYDDIMEALKSMFSPDDIDASFNWYLPGMDLIGDFNWEFVTNYEFSEDEIKTLWLAKDKEGLVVAYTTAIYDVKSKLFKDIVWGKMTTVGMRYIPATGSNLHPDTSRIDKKQVNDLMQSIKKIDIKNEFEYSDELEGKTRDAQMMMKQYFMEEERKMEQKKKGGQ